MATPNLTAVDFSKKGKGGKDDFQMTADEARRIEEKMKDPEFMKLWVEYAQSLADPKVREEEEAYLRQIEEEAKDVGDDSFDFVFPKAAFAVELTDCPDRLKDHRVAVNVCTSDKVERFREETTGDRQGSHWYVPVSVGAGRVEKHDGGNWEVYDAVFHPLTVDLANRSDKFMVFLCEIAVEHINGGYKRRFDFKFARMPSSVQSIGTPKNQTVRRSSSDKNNKKKDGPAEVSIGPIRATINGDIPVPPPSTNNKKAEVKSSTSSPSSSASPQRAPLPKKVEGNINITVAHRGEIDLTDAWNWSKSDKRIGIPRELVLRAQLPGVAGAGEIDVEVPGGAKVEIAVPTRNLSGSILLDFTVGEDPVSAKFDKVKKELSLIFKVIPPPAPPSAIAPEEEAAPAKKKDGEDDDDDDDEDEELKKKKLRETAAEKRRQQEKETDEQMQQRAARAKQAAEGLEQSKKKQAQDAEAAAARKQQEEADAALRARQEAWRREEDQRKAEQEQREKAVAAEKDKEAQAARAKAEAAEKQQKQEQQQRAAAEAEAARKRKEADDAAAAAAASAASSSSKKADAEDDNLLLIDDDDEDFQLVGEQKAKLDDAEALREVAKKKADAQRQEEAMQAELDKKMKSLPLTNEFIFGID